MSEEKKEREIKTPTIKKNVPNDMHEAKIILKPGQVYMVQTDANGDEILGTGSITSLKTFQTSFSHLNFKIKKKG